MTRACHPHLDIGRRDLLVGGAALSLSACAKAGPGPQPLPPVPSIAIGDAHVHLFNGADLPVSGFFRNVLVPAYLSNWPDLALAMIDSAFGVLKAWSRSARDELGDLASLAPAPADLTPSGFADRFAARAEQQMHGASTDPERRDPRHKLADSYAALAEVIAMHGRALGQGQARSLTELRAQERSGGLPTIDRGALSDIAQNGAASARTNVTADLLGRSPAEVFALIAWAFRMTHSRARHVREYLDAMTTSSGARPSLLINLLVDYDDWLGDAPKAGSLLSDQVRFWTRYSARPSSPLQIETFAGFDPLKHAIEKRLGATPYFDAMKRWALTPAGADQRISGFKLYPPMGFRVWKNVSLPAASPDGRAAEIVRALWQGKGWNVDDLPAHLDGALDELFAFTTANDIPLLAHGRDSNEAFPGAGKNAHPSHWLARARALPPTPARHPLRACIAHFRKDFDQGKAAEDIIDLNLNRGSNIYFDVAFDDELLDSTQADRLLQDMQAICRSDPRAAKYFMFGSDWIMLAQIPNADRYLQSFDQAVLKSPFWAPLRGDLLGGNLRRFLKLAPS